MYDSASESREWNRFKRFAWVCLVMSSLLILVGLLYFPMLLSIVAGGIVAYIFDPLVDRLLARLPINRKSLVTILVILAVALCAVTAVLVVPYIYEELSGIFQRVPEALNSFEQMLIPLVNWLKQTKIFPEETIEAGFRRLNLLQSLASPSGTVQNIVLQTPALLEAAFNLFMVPAVTYLFLAEKEHLSQLAKRWTPKDVHPLISVYLHRVDGVLRSVVKGQFLIAFILAILYMAGFSLINVPSGVAIGAIAGFCRLVPYLDVVVGIALTSIVVMTQGIGFPVFLAVLGVVAVVQSLDGMIITPRIIGDRAGLHPIVVIASVFAFGSWFGLLGVLLAVPIVAATVVVLQTCLPYLKSSPFYRQGDTLVSDASSIQD